MSIRKALESLYKGRCNIYNSEDCEENSITKTRRREIYSDVPCKLSYGTSVSHSPAVKQSVAPGIEQTITLFINPDIDIPAGSEIEVTQNKVTRVYNMSGEPKVYSNHQEITLELKEKFV